MPPTPPYSLISRPPGGLCVWGELCAALPLPSKQWYHPPLEQGEWEEGSGPLLLRWPGPTGIPGPSLQGKDLPVPWPDLRGQRIPWSGQGEPPGPGQVPVLRQHFTLQPGDLRQPDSEGWAQVQIFFYLDERFSWFLKFFIQQFSEKSAVTVTNDGLIHWPNCLYYYVILYNIRHMTMYKTTWSYVLWKSNISRLTQAYPCFCSLSVPIHINLK